MELIRTKRVLPKWDTDLEKDKVLFQHVEEVTPILEQNKADRLGNLPFHRGQDAWHVGRIPMTLFLQHPEWSEDPKALLKFLKSSEGEPYRCSNRI